MAFYTEKSNSTVLKSFVQMNCGCIRTALHAMWESPDLSSSYLRFLVLLHQITRASVPLLQLGCDLAGERNEPSDKALLDYYFAHIQSEKSHDVWFLEDLENAELPASFVLSLAPSPWVASLVGSQYYWMIHHDPVSLLGYIAILEGNPPSSTHIDFIKLETSLPEQVFRTYRLHSEADPFHIQSLYEVVDSLPLAPSRLMQICTSALQTAHHLALCIENIDLIPLPNKA